MAESIENIINAINNHIVIPIEHYLRQSDVRELPDKAVERHALVHLINTLKYFANPLGKYKNVFPPKAVCPPSLQAYFAFLQQVINNPNNLGLSLDNKEIELFSILLCYKLDAIANEISEEYISQHASVI